MNKPLLAVATLAAAVVACAALLAAGGQSPAMAITDPGAAPITQWRQR